MFLPNEKKSKLLQPVANTSSTPLPTYPENGSKIASDSTIGTVTSVVKLALSGAYSYFLGKGGGHLCIISSSAGTKGLRASRAYSASKAFQLTDLDTLEQLSVKR